VQVVEQDAHAHATVGRGEQVLRDELAGRVAVEDVVLEVDRMLRAIGERKAREQCVDRVREKAQPRVLAVRSAELSRFGDDRRVVHRRERRAWLAHVVRLEIGVRARGKRKRSDEDH